MDESDLCFNRFTKRCGVYSTVPYSTVLYSTILYLLTLLLRSNMVFSLETPAPLTWMLAFHSLDRGICRARSVRVY